jgi:hypothetical protein
VSSKNACYHVQVTVSFEHGKQTGEKDACKSN